MGAAAGVGVEAGVGVGVEAGAGAGACDLAMPPPRRAKC